MAVPMQLRANDITKHILNVDSRFRQNPATTLASDFYYNIDPSIKNVLRIRITSIEFPNNYPYFTARRCNVSIRFLYKEGLEVMQFIIDIPEGNYTAEDMVEALNGALQAPGGVPWITASFDCVTGFFTFTGTKYFGIDTTFRAQKRLFDYGLGFNLGLTRGLHKAIKDEAGKYIVVSDFCASFTGDNYVFLKINDFDCVRHNTDDTLVSALAKIILREPKNYMVYDDYASQHAKEVVFTAPQNLSRLHVQVLDAYGMEVDLCQANLSFSIEILEIKNSQLYNAVRESLAIQYV